MAFFRVRQRGQRPAFQQEFVHSLNTYLMSNTEVENLIIGGYWNISLHAIDKKGGNPWKLTVSRDLVVTMMKEFDLKIGENGCLQRGKSKKTKAIPMNKKRLNFVRALISF